MSSTGLALDAKELEVDRNMTAVSALGEGLADALDTEAAVHALVDVATSAVGTKHGGCTILHARQRFDTLGATDQRVEEADNLQYELKEGPCVDSSVKSRHHASSHLRTDDRWPNWGPTAADLGFHSILSAEMHSRGRRVGALNLYGDAEREFTTEDLELARALAHIGGAVLGLAFGEVGIRQALSSRGVIGQAQGILMEKLGVDADVAFAALRRISQDSNIRLAEVAAQTVASRGDNLTP